MSDPHSTLDETGTHKVPNTGTLARILGSVMVAGRAILNRRRGEDGDSSGQPDAIARRCGDLIRHRGEASGLALASEILDDYENLEEEGRSQFFDLLLKDFATDPEKVIQASKRYRDQPEFEQLLALQKSIASPRQKLFRRLNQAPGGTGALVRMRGDLIVRLRDRPDLGPIDADLKHLLIAWFNRGFLTLERVDWDSSARVLEKIIQYEAVHEINGWDDLRGRLREDRRLFAFFHPAMPDDPVIFIEIALSKGSSSAIQPLLDSDRDLLDTGTADTATFYSISNCHRGLQGISFGNFLIKQVTENLRFDLENIQRFETLSPVPGFRQWLQQIMNEGAAEGGLADAVNSARALLSDDGVYDEHVEHACEKLCAHYLINEKRNGLPLDPVARFHLSNGAYLDRINLNADISVAGKSRSFGVMVNYVYDLTDIETNHEAYFAESQVATSSSVRKLAAN
ncbi:MAG: malonyl-CoA decarboxylase family protein [Pseudomonadota bacterium]